MTEEASLLLALVRQGAEKATVCTEPAMIAFAAAKSKSLISESPARVEVTVSPGVMKNCLAVGLPGTDRKGPEIAAALGAVVGRPEMGLEALSGVDPRTVREAHRLLDSNSVKASCSLRYTGVYCLARVVGATRTAEVTIEGNHTRITRMMVDGQVVVEQPVPPEGMDKGDPAPSRWSSMESVKQFSYGFLLDMIMSADVDEIQYLQEGALSALSLAEQSLHGGCSVSLPDFPHALSNILTCAPAKDEVGRSLITKARLWVAAAVCARMAGVIWPVLTSCGSGNQGISISIPVLLAARAVNAGPIKEVKSLLLAHATNLYVKAFTGNISALCGAVSAGAGVAASVCWLMGGHKKQVEGAAQTVIGNLYGMLCDGAKASCALKCAAGAAEGALAGQMAVSGVFSHGEAGIVGCSLGETLCTIGSFSPVLNQVDPLIVGVRGARIEG
ncbi:MAG: serine dehydratase subunit alpha family protein [Firmicutes bacterium]|nr:serine dehydratase subunit alpha family protein [Bacillota bacterium]